MRIIALTPVAPLLPPFGCVVGSGPVRGDDPIYRKRPLCATDCRRVLKRGWGLGAGTRDHTSSLNLHFSIGLGLRSAAFCKWRSHFSSDH